MNIKPLLLASAISVLASSAWAQSTNQSLNLKLPSNLPAGSSTAATAPASSATTASTPAPTSVHPGAVASNGHTANTSAATNTPPISTTPGVYYGDTSGRLGGDGTADTQTCDDSKYNDAQVHGAVSTGVATGSHMGTSTYQGATVNVTKAFGDCDHPSGGVSFSISVNQNQFSGGRYRGY
jgi:hypothetical protein